MRFPDPERSRAVLIGTSRYTDENLPDLPEVSRTVKDFAAALTGSGVLRPKHCKVLCNENSVPRIGDALVAAGEQAEDLLLVYFAGHGLVAGLRHDLYLALPGSNGDAPEWNALEYDKVRNAVLHRRATTKVIILDCCFSGRVVTDTMTGSGIIDQLDIRGSYVLAAAQRDQLALIIPGEKHTAFTGRLLTTLHEGIPDGPDVLTIEDLYRELRARMRSEGLPEPQMRATGTAGLLPIAENHATTRTALPKVHEQVIRRSVLDTPDDCESPERAQTRTYGGKYHLQYIERLEANDAWPRDEQPLAQRRIVAEFNHLLDVHPSIVKWSDQYYDQLLDTVLDDPVTYADYLWVADSTSTPWDLSLLRALDRRLPKANLPWLLVQHELGTDLAWEIENRSSPSERLDEWLARRLVADAIWVMAADQARSHPGGEPTLRPGHGRMLFEAMIPSLLAPSRINCDEIKRLGYLSPALDYYFADDRPGQTRQAMNILRATYAVVGNSAIKEIFRTSEYPPTNALLTAVTELAPNYQSRAQIEFNKARKAHEPRRSATGTHSSVRR